MTMTSAEFKCLRESLGLSTKWLSLRWDVSEYSVQRWERNRTLPEALERDMLSLKTIFDEAVTKAADAGTGLAVPRIDAETDRYPAAWYRAVAQRARERSGAEITFRGDARP